MPKKRCVPVCGSAMSIPSVFSRIIGGMLSHPDWSLREEGESFYIQLTPVPIWEISFIRKVFLSGYGGGEMGNITWRHALYRPSSPFSLLASLPDFPLFGGEERFSYFHLDLTVPFVPLDESIILASYHEGPINFGAHNYDKGPFPFSFCSSRISLMVPFGQPWPDELTNGGSWTSSPSYVSSFCAMIGGQYA